MFEQDDHPALLLCLWRWCEYSLATVSRLLAAESLCDTHLLWPAYIHLQFGQIFHLFIQSASQGC